MKLNDDNIALKIIFFLIKEDRPLIENHIAKGIQKSPQIVDYHLKNLVEQGVILKVEESNTKYYLLQPSFYMKKAETALMNSLTPWIKEFAKQTEITDDMNVEEKQVRLNNFYYYFLVFIQKIFENI